MPVSPGLPRWVAARLLLFSHLRVTPNSEICSMTTTAFRSSSLHMALGAVTLFLSTIPKYITSHIPFLTVT